MTSSLDEIRRVAAAASGLAVAVTVRADGTPHASVVSAGVLAHPLDGEGVVGFVAGGRAVKLGNLRARPYASVVFRSGWEWAAAEGPAELAGPDDELAGLEVTPSASFVGTFSPPPAERTRTSTSTTG